MLKLLKTNLKVTLIKSKFNLGQILEKFDNLTDSFSLKMNKI